MQGTILIPKRIRVQKIEKESASGEKRKLESNKDYNKDTGNGDYSEEYSSSAKRRKERVEDGVSDRWNGGGDADNNRSEGTKKLKEKSSESKSRRRDESAGGEAYVEIEEVVKKSSGKSEGKHRESSSRKEGREGGIERERDREKEREKERRGKEGKSDKLIDGDDLRVVKQVSDKTGKVVVIVVFCFCHGEMRAHDLNARDILQSPDSEYLPDRRNRRKRDGSGDGDKHQNDIGDNNDRRLSSKEDVAKDGRLKDEKHKDEKYRVKYRDDVDRESRHRDDKQRDEHTVKDHNNSRSDDKHLRDDKDTAEIKTKKYKPQDGDREREREHDHDCDYDLGRDHNHESYQRDRDRDHDRDRERDRDRDHDYDRERDWDWDRDRDRERERDRDRDRERDRDRNRERNLDYDGAHVDDRGARYKDSRGRKRSPEDHDDHNDARARGGKTSYLDMEKKSLSSNRVDSDTDRGRSQSRQAHSDSNRRRASPNTSSHGAADEYRQFKQEELKYRDAVIEQRSKSTSSREVTNLPGSSDRVSKYRSSEKSTKMDDGHLGELSLERSSSSKASPMGVMDRSPSSTSLERNRYMNRSSVRRSLDIEESGRRSSASMGARDMSSADERTSRDLPLEKSLLDETTSVDSSFYNRNSQSNSTLLPPSSAFRGGVGSPSFLGSLEEDGRINTGKRYMRGGDPNLGRGQGNAWRGAPNWSSPVPNGYIPFQHGPPHGYQAMMPQFPSPRLFGVRPSMEINHPGIPYHISEADRFSAHLRPLGWQNMMDGSGPSHMHGWDGNNGVFRDEAHIYGGSEWDQNRHPINGRGWESNADIWKGQNGDVNLDLPSTSLKEDFPAQAPVDDISAGQGGQRSQNENIHLGVAAKTVETKIAVIPSTKELSNPSTKTIHEKLDISIELADPELYNQFTSLLNIEHGATVDADAAMLVNLKDGARAIPKSSSTLLNSSLFPITSDSVFQRAMDIYKKQREWFSGSSISNGRIVDVIAASKKEEQFSNNNVDIVEEQTSKRPAETSRVQMMNLDETKVETVPIADVQENPDDTVPIADMPENPDETVPVADMPKNPDETVQVPENSDVSPCQEVDVDAHAPDVKLEFSGQALSHDIPKKSMIFFSGDKMDGLSSNLVDSEGPGGDFVTTPEDVPNAARVLPIDGHNTDEIGKIKGSNSFNCAEEGQGFGDAICGPLLVKDGSPKASGDLMPGSNESESVIISRIHHSPENTH
ncbi:hypothetical protein RCOM_1579370 [Ricinus communis]|uniref:Uncharacterized protein n=1 Tax=Ricinus communis TaxID=3988 RepID=B9RII1_RICCO|nr:hypothetical protein RCOM_1579370 [Ricinus communis]